jgi:hypothetical protein
MFWKRRDRDAVKDRDDVVERRDVVDRGEYVEHRETERAWGGPPLVRGLFTLLGVAAAGFLVWLATLFDLEATGEFWAAMGILAGAGAALGLSQLFGGWTKWGRPTISPGVFLLGFLPALVVAAGILIATRPTGTAEGEDVAGWIRDIGLGGLAGDLSVFQGVLAFGLGVVFSFIFDTVGPRSRVVARDREAVVPDEDVHDYDRRDVATTPPTERTVVREDETVPAGSVDEERVVRERRDVT